MVSSRSFMKSARSYPGTKSPKFSRLEQAVPYGGEIPRAAPSRVSTDSVPKNAPTMSQTWNAELPAGCPELVKTCELDQIYILPPEKPDGFSDRADGDRLHFRYGDPYIPHASNSRDEDLSEEDAFDEEFARSCIKIFSNCLSRRLSRAMIELIGIEPNPGPPPSQKKKSRNSRARMAKEVSTKPQTRAAPAIKPQKSLSYMSGDPFNPRRDMSSYMMTLSDAERYPAVRLGGETMIPTALVGLHGMSTITLSTYGNYSIVVHPRIWSSIGVSNQQFSGPSQATNTAGYSYAFTNIFLSSTVGQLQSLADSARVVSAKLKVYTLSGATSDNGALTVGLSPRDDGFQGSFQTTSNGYIYSGNENVVSRGGFPVTNAVLSTQPTSPAATTVFAATQGYQEFSEYEFVQTSPLKTGASCFWLPEDPQSFDFVPDRVQAQSFATSGANGQVNTLINSSPIVDPFFVVGIEGATVGSQIAVELYLNLEYVVSSGSSGVVSTALGSMSTDQAFHVAKRIGGGMDTLAEPSPEASLGDKIWGTAKNVIRSGLGGASKFLFGSSDIGSGVADLIGL